MSAAWLDPRDRNPFTFTVETAYAAGTPARLRVLAVWQDGGWVFEEVLRACVLDAPGEPCEDATCECRENVEPAMTVPERKALANYAEAAAKFERERHEREERERIARVAARANARTGSTRPPIAATDVSDFWGALRISAVLRAHGRRGDRQRPARADPHVRDPRGRLPARGVPAAAGGSGGK